MLWRSDLRSAATTPAPAGPEAAACAALIEAHKVCLRAEGFIIE